MSVFRRFVLIISQLVFRVKLTTLEDVNVNWYLDGRYDEDPVNFHLEISVWN